MIDIKFLRENPNVVKDNIKKKFQDHKLVLVDEVISLDKESRELTVMCDELRSKRNSKSKEIGGLMAKGQKQEAEKLKSEVEEINKKLAENEGREEELKEEIKSRMMKIPNIMDSSVPIGKDDSENVENEKFGEPVVPNYEIPHHADILDSICGLDKESAGRTSRKWILLFTRRCSSFSRSNACICKRFYD